MLSTSAPDLASETSKTTTRRRLDYIDALRGGACFWVLLHHLFLAPDVPAGLWYYPTVFLLVVSSLGWLGVSLFLVLSGFCLFYPLAVRYDLDKISLDIKTFAQRRAKRILPPYYAALFLLAAFEMVSDGRRTGHWDWHSALKGPADLILHLLMLHNLSPDTVTSVSFPFWSLALETQLYCIFPLLVWGISRFGLNKPLAVAFLISLVWQTGCYLHLGTTMGWTTAFTVYYHALPGRCFEFAAGMVAASLVARPRPGQSRFALILFAVLLVPALYLVLRVARFAPLCDQIWGIIFASALVLLCHVPNLRFERNIVLRGFVWLGTISYSVYLTHHPLIGLLSPGIAHPAYPPVALRRVYAGFSAPAVPNLNRVPFPPRV